ncbi:MAG: heavy-metal-associated domain-containing protein [Gammaproteobacteria bacterium]
MNTTTFRIDGMHCDGCAGRIRTLLGKEPGVREARVSFAEGEAAVRFNFHTVSQARLREVIETGGFNVVETTA